MNKGSTSTLREASRTNSALTRDEQDAVVADIEDQMMKGVTQKKIGGNLEITIPNKAMQTTTPLILSNRMLYHAAMTTLNHRL